MISQKEIELKGYRRGCHLITSIIENAIHEWPETGLLHIHLKHTSAGITLNENADPSVRTDFHYFLNKLVPENDPAYTHTLEGSDDMPAHLKASLIGQSVTIPVSNYRMNLGIWQGVYFCEFRNNGGNRKLVLTLYY